MRFEPLESTMSRLTRFRQFRISNRLAVFAAFLLLAATVAGTTRSVNNPLGDPVLQSAAAQDATAPVKTNSKSLRTVRNNKPFKISLYLFRRN